jgi:hypothetical protein
MRCAPRRRCWVGILLRPGLGVCQIPQMSQHRKQQNETNARRIRRLEEVREATEEQMERLETVALDLLAEIRLTRQALFRKCKRPG